MGLPKLDNRTVRLIEEIPHRLVVFAFESFGKLLEFGKILGQDPQDLRLIGHDDVTPDIEGASGESRHIAPPAGGHVCRLAGGGRL